MEGKPWTKSNAMLPKPTWWLGCKRATRGEQPRHKQVCPLVSRMPIGCGRRGDGVEWSAGGV